MGETHVEQMREIVDAVSSDIHTSRHQRRLQQFLNSLLAVETNNVRPPAKAQFSRRRVKVVPGFLEPFMNELITRHRTTRGRPPRSAA